MMLSIISSYSSEEEIKELSNRLKALNLNLSEELITELPNELKALNLNSNKELIKELSNRLKALNLNSDEGLITELSNRAKELNTAKELNMNSDESDVFRWTWKCPSCVLPMKIIESDYKVRLTFYKFHLSRCYKAQGIREDSGLYNENFLTMVVKFVEEIKPKKYLQYDVCCPFCDERLICQKNYIKAKLKEHINSKHKNNEQVIEFCNDGEINRYFKNNVKWYFVSSPDLSFN